MKSEPDSPLPVHRDPPWNAGLRAARANFVPGLLVQGVMLSLLLAYYFYPPTRDWLNLLAGLKASWSYGYSAVSSIIAGAVIPEFLRILVFQGGRLRRANLGNFLFASLFWCAMGVTVDYFYRCQALWFGDQVDFQTVATKVLVDQLIYNTVFAAPVTAWLYDWKNRGYQTAGTRCFFTTGYYRDTIVPTLCATWGVWIPVVSILYSLPSLLQIPLFGLALALWVMLYTWMSENKTAA